MKLTFKKAILKGCYVLTLKPFDDGLVRRPDSKWEVVSLIGEADDITVTLLTIGEAPPNKVCKTTVVARHCVSVASV